MPLNWPSRKPQLAHLTIVLYGRPLCHLCHAAEAILHSRQSRYGFRLEKVDIDDDLDLAAKYGDWIPVVEIAGKLRFRGRVDERLLDRLLEALPGP